MSRNLFDQATFERLRGQLRQRVFHVATMIRNEMRRVSPVLTGRYRASHQVSDAHTIAPGVVESEITNRDIPGKVRVIEFGFPPSRPELRGRAPRRVFQLGLEFGERQAIAQANALANDLINVTARSGGTIEIP